MVDQWKFSCAVLCGNRDMVKVRFTMSCSCDSPVMWCLFVPSQWITWWFYSCGEALTL